MDRRELLDRAAHSPEERLLLSRVWDKCEQCCTRNIPTATGFLSPQEQAAAQHLLNALGCREGYVLWGGYDGAERRRLVFLPDWLETPDDQVAAVRAACRSGGDLTHRDFLGSLMALGLTREKIGDILVEKGGCQVLLDPSMTDFLLQNWDSAGREKLTVTPLPLSALAGPPCGGEGTAGHRLLPAAGQRAGGGIFSQPGPGGGGRGKGVRTGELRHLCEAGQARVGGGYHHLPRSGKMRIGQRGRSHEKGPPAGGHTAIHIREKQLWTRRR